MEYVEKDPKPEEEPLQMAKPYTLVLLRSEGGGHALVSRDDLELPQAR